MGGMVRHEAQKSTPEDEAGPGWFRLGTILMECHADIGREIELHKYGHDLKASGGISNPRLQMRRASNLGKHRAPSTGTRGSSIVQS